MGFKEQLSQEEREGIAARTFDEVTTKSNFYFRINEHKRDQNLKVFNPKAPGVKHKHPSVALPHENVHIQHYIDTKGLDEEKRFEIYAYYSYLTDLHISQIRPQNLKEKSYIPPQFNQIASIMDQNQHLNNMFFEFYHRWREPTRTWMSQTQEIDFQKEIDALPTTDHYDHEKGSKYDVEWTEDQKFPHVANRLGYPILREEPIERILGIERAPAHPGYQFQPFVQTPSLDPDPTLNFQPGEVIYENPRVTEWVRLWKTLTAGTLLTWPAFLTFEIYAGDGVPSLRWLADSWLWHQIPMQFQDGGGLGLEEYRYCDDHSYMNFQYTGKRLMARPAHTFYVLTVLGFLQHINMDYVSKMTYNKDKDLVFVTRPDGLWGEHEHVYEVHHLERMVPSAVTSWKDLSAQRDDGILSVHCMDTKDYLKFYNEDKYWNMDLKPEFMKETGHLWEGYTCKYAGQIFDLGKEAPEDVALAVRNCVVYTIVANEGE